MSTLKEPKPVKLVFSVIYNKATDTDIIKGRLNSMFGEIDFESDQLNFEHSDYYTKEMGGNLKRKFFSIKKLINREEIVNLKRLANELENEYMVESRRCINVDPGYLAHEHLILATGKGFAHRPYLGKGVYAELTLIYTQNEYHSLDWTYPDYKENEVKDIFKHLRKIYISNLCEDKQDD